MLAWRALAVPLEADNAEIQGGGGSRESFECRRFDAGCAVRQFIFSVAASKRK